MSCPAVWSTLYNHMVMYTVGGRMTPARLTPRFGRTEGRDHIMQKMTPFPWFDGKAEEATNFYVGIFRNSRVLSVNPQGKDGPVFSTTFNLDGMAAMAAMLKMKKIDMAALQKAYDEA